MIQERTTVLIVEDEALLRITLVEFLTECGFGVCEAANADEAIAALARDDLDVDVVFTDVRMPGRLDGIALARSVFEHRPGLPVFITSGDVGKINVGNDLCAGEKFFAKPYTFEDVEGRIRQSIAQHKHS